MRERAAHSSAVLALLVFLVLSALGTVAPQAQTLRAGISTAATTPDPHVLDNGGNNTLYSNIYERLTRLDERQRVTPGLATSWRTIDDRTWEFELRQGVRFHNGAAFTADDVVASIARVRRMTTSPAPYVQFVRPIAAVEAIAPHRLRIRTAAPFPLLPVHLALISIIPRANADADTPAFNSLAAAIGTGPYRLVRWVPDEGVELVRNDAWWGARPVWERVILRRIPRDTMRTAALLAGDVDIIDQVLPADAEQLAARGGFVVHRAVSGRLMYIHLDSARERTPFAAGLDGAPIANPLRDVRVRRALSLAIDRHAIAQRLFGGLAVPTAGVVPQSFFGAIDDPAPTVDPAEARRLLAEAGLPDGFALQLNGPNDRYPMDEQVMQTVAAMWARIGVRTRVEAQPAAVSLARASRLELSAYLYGNSSTTGEPMNTLRALLGTYDPQRGTGAANRGRYSNPELDAMIARAEVTLDDEERARILADATRLAMRDVGMIVLYHLTNTWASRRGIVAEPRADEQFRAADIRLAP
ncbi:MAG: ABC transporter substrate-binding protein [Alphaproteobacteria bacterium]|nr:ABC transporter substrate-binding protein [Alphaproteobacteria bacterium]